MIEQILTSSILILAVCLLRGLFEKRISSCMKYALWLLVAVKLLVPLPDFKTHLSVMNVMNQLEKPIVSEGVNRKMPELPDVTETVMLIETDNSAKETERTTGVLESADSTEETKRTTGTAELVEKTGAVGNIKVVLRGIWLLGASAIMVAFVWANLKFSLELRKKRQYKETYHKLKVYRISQRISPCLYGIRPAIYVSSKFEISDEKLMYILSHEYTHYRHGDHIWAVVRCICVVLYWYNPFVWLAAMLSVKDGELACDEGTIKRIGEENRLDYGKTLIETIKIMGTKSSRIQVLNCSTSMAGGIKDMQKRMKFIAKRSGVKKSAMALMLALCVALIRCTFGKAEETSGKGKQELPESYQSNELQGYSGELEDVIDEYKTKELTEAAQMEEQDGIEPENSLKSGLSYGNVILQEEPSADKVSIQIDPPMLRERVSYYYTPEGEEQEKLSAWMKGIEEKLEEQWEVFDKRWSGRKEAGWTIWYHGRGYTAFEDGYFYYQPTYEESPEVLEYCRQNEELYQFVSGMMEELGYHTMDISKIKDIISAKLEIQGIRADYKEEIRTITDRKILSEFEKWFSEAEYMFGGADCANNDACLTLTLADGSNVKLSLATDGCPIFAINGVYYNYTPEGPEGYRINREWNNNELFQCFDEAFVIQ